MGLPDLPPSERTTERQTQLLLEQLLAREGAGSAGAGPMRLPPDMAKSLGNFGGTDLTQDLWAQQSRTTLTVRVRVLDNRLTITLTSSDGGEPFTVEFT